MKRKMIITLWAIIIYFIVAGSIATAIAKPEIIFIGAGLIVFGCIWKYVAQQYDN